MNPEEVKAIATAIRDWFLEHKGHYAGWSDFEADIDMTVDFEELAQFIVDRTRITL